MMLQEDLNKTIHWSIKNNMELNGDKFKVLNYCLNRSLLLRSLPLTNSHLQYYLPDGSPIEQSQTVKDLGILLSNDCSWSPHISQMLIAARKGTAWVLSVFRSRSPLLMLTLFKTMVRSKLEYCCPVWDPVKIEDIQAIENIQRNFTRRISSCRDLRYWKRLKRLQLMSLQRRRERYIIIHTWKIINGAAPNDINMEFKENTRLGIKAIIPKINTKAQTSVSTHYFNSFGVKAARLWNILPKEVNEKCTLDSFKNSLGGFLSRIPDTPPTSGYTAANNNSLIQWNTQRISTHRGSEGSHVDAVRL